MACWNVIDHTELSGNATSYEVTSISSAYEHLYCVISARSDKSGYNYEQVDIQLSGDTGSNYYSTWFQMYKAASPFSGGYLTGRTHIDGAYINAASQAGDTFSPMEILIPNYSNAVGDKQVIVKGGCPNWSTSDYEYMVYLVGGLHDSTAAVDEFKLTLTDGNNFIQYSTFTLYGINGA